jgi:hypothetical protein
MDATAIINAMAGLLTALAAVGAVAFQFWRAKKMRRRTKKRPRK